MCPESRNDSRERAGAPSRVHPLNRMSFPIAVATAGLEGRPPSRAASLFRWGERVLWVIGATLLGWCAFVWIDARVYQAQQSRAFDEMQRAVRSSAVPSRAT